MMREISDEEFFVVDRMRRIAAEGGNGRGHGTLRVEINEGRATLVKREVSEKVPGFR